MPLRSVPRQVSLAAASLASLVLAACSAPGAPDAGPSVDGSSVDARARTDVGAGDAGLVVDASVQVPCEGATAAPGVRCEVLGGELLAPRDVWTTLAGDIVVSEFSAGRVVMLRDGEWTSVVDGLVGPIGLRQDAAGLLVGEENAHLLARISAAGERSVLSPELGNVTYLATASDGTIFVSAFSLAMPVGGGVVYRVAPDTGAATPFATGMNTPEGLFVTSDGTLFVVEWTLPTAVLRFGPGGGDVASATRVAEGFDHAYGLFPDQAGGFYVGDHAGRVVHVDEAGASTVVLDGIGRPGGISRHPSGDLLVTEFVDFGAAGRVLRLSGALP